MNNGQQQQIASRLSADSYDIAPGAKKHSKSHKPKIKKNKQAKSKNGKSSKANCPPGSSSGSGNSSPGRQPASSSMQQEQQIVINVPEDIIPAGVMVAPIGPAQSGPAQVPGPPSGSPTIAPPSAATTGAPSNGAATPAITTMPQPQCADRPALGDTTNDSFEQECLGPINTDRSMHSGQALTISQQLVQYARSRCNTISQCEGLANGHAGLTMYGENIFWSGDTNNVTAACSAAVSNWYDERTDYDYNMPGFSVKTGHFTQLVWLATGQVGCARCEGRGSMYYETYVVCNFETAGNVDGQYADNVKQS
ncbi:uncharacterized protein LOC128965202 [Oppia nitens]|uniref:uncharacterized protein LOC128965202 n=1 Tax=Oppia nitens TaxID=1686743 RepID=UPI0023DAFB58|nr:uncharacterized protein LOC128965202 [Oppia nitens]